MASKAQVAMRLASSGVRVIIANGRRDGILTDVLTSPGSTVHTEFVPAK
jgi:glutamate 5-kinase